MVSLRGEDVAYQQFVLWGGQGGDAFEFAVGDNGAVAVSAGIAMDDQAASGDVEDPILDDSGAGVEASLDVEVETQRAVGDFDYEGKIAGLGL